MREHNLPPLVPDHQILKIPAQLLQSYTIIFRPQRILQLRTMEILTATSKHCNVRPSPDIQDICPTLSYTRNTFKYLPTEVLRAQSNSLQFCITFCNMTLLYAKFILKLCKLNLKSVQNSLHRTRCVGDGCGRGGCPHSSPHCFCILVCIFI